MGGPSERITNDQYQLNKTQQALAQQSANQSNKLFGTTFPGINTAENYYQKLASGDPLELQKLLGPANQQVTAAGASTKQNIQNTMARGGTKDLAKAMVDIGTAGQIGSNATKAYTQAFPALASLGTQGVGLSINQLANAISGNSSAGTQLANVGQEQAAGKASTMGFLGSLAGAGGQLGAAAMLA